MAPPKLTEFEQARAIVLELAEPLGAERVGLREALGRCLAEDVAGTDPVPAFDNSAMDGFAVRAADTAGARPGSPVVLEVAGESRAGHPSGHALGAGEAISISTGAMLPAGADAVVRVESARRRGDRVLVGAEVAPGLDVRRAGEDVATGETVLSRGARIGPAQLGVLASLDCDPVCCHRRARVTILTSGDELRMPGEPLPPGGVRNSNAYSVPALVAFTGAEVCSVAWTPDEPAATRVAIEAGLDADVMIACGGVSVGEHDHVKRALAELGVEEAFWGVALKPGKPTWFGARGETLVFGLPGNPVSAMVAFALFVRPALAVLGGGRAEPLRTTARLARSVDKPPGRTHAIRCRLELGEDGWRAHPAERQGSHVLTSMLAADCLALLPAESGPLRAGERVEVELLDGVSMAS